MRVIDKIGLISGFTWHDANGLQMRLDWPGRYI